jgi:tetratricopeptide (TPR) repeat protein
VVRAAQVDPLTTARALEVARRTLSSGEVAEVRDAAVARCAQGWAEAIRKADLPQLLVERLGAVLAAPPRSAPVPGLNEAVDAVLEGLIAEQRALPLHSEGAVRLSRQITGLEYAALAHLDRGRVPSEAYAEFVHRESLLNLAAEIYLAELRVGPAVGRRAVPKRVDREACERLFAERPESRAARYLIARAYPESEAAPQRLAWLSEAAEGTGLLDDVHPGYQVVVLFGFAEELVTDARHAGPGDPRWERVRAVAARAAELADGDPELLRELVALRVRIAQHTEGPDGAVAAWREGIEALGKAREGSAPEREEFFLLTQCQLRLKLAQYLVDRGRLDAAVAEAKYLRTNPVPMIPGEWFDVESAYVLARVAERRGREAEALALMEPFLTEADMNRVPVGMAVRAGKIALRLGEPKRALRFLRPALQQYPKDAELLELLAEAEGVRK